MKYLSRFIARLGGGLKTSVNTEDFYTGMPVSRIPAVFLFRFSTLNIVCDIRSLYDYGGKTLLRNPYTSEEASAVDSLRYSRMLHWLQKFRWPISHIRQEEDDNLDLQRFTVNVFSEMSSYHYVDYQWFLDLSPKELILLYIYLHDLWSFRLELTVSQQRAISRDPVCDLNHLTDLTDLNHLTDLTHLNHLTGEDHMRLKLLREISKLFSGEAKEEGSMILLLALVLVSPAAAASYPALFAASNY
jgi:hypothetical protein